MPHKLTNQQARRLWLWTNGLADIQTEPLDLMAVIHRLGFVQLDTIRNVSRAHHHILWSRNQHYREAMLWSALKDDRTLFEHFTHDASLLPIEFYPMWQRQFRRKGERMVRLNGTLTEAAKAQIHSIWSRIEAEGPLSTLDFDSKITGPRKMWSRPPHKKALDKMWFDGTLTTSHRVGFTKFYDLTERVIPERFRAIQHADADQIDWLCRAALDRLSVANQGEIQRFWGAMSAVEVKKWIAAQPDLQNVEISCADGSSVSALAPADIAERLANLPEPSSRIRILNPFDPAIRDRTRLKRLFGFDYRNEMFVPRAKRIWGYYVYPLLEGDRFIGRMEIKADRAAGILRITGFWREAEMTWGTRRQSRLEAELVRFGRLADVTEVVWDCPRPGN